MKTSKFSVQITLEVNVKVRYCCVVDISPPRNPMKKRIVKLKTYDSEEALAFMKEMKGKENVTNVFVERMVVANIPMRRTQQKHNFTDLSRNIFFPILDERLVKGIYEEFGIDQVFNGTHEEFLQLDLNVLV